MEREGTARTKAIGIVRRLQSAGFDAFFVGGCVRDQLQGVEPVDFDIATSARPEEIEELFPRTTPVGRKFGVIIINEDGPSFQVATFRAEGEYRDGRHPEKVTFADAITDARRRDFTINGLFFDPIAGQLYDWVGGKADLEAGLLRTIGEPHERFAEDHLRLLRAVRFAAQLRLTIEPGTLVALRAGAANILRVSPERIRDELLKLFRPPHATHGLELLRETGMLEHVLPEIADTIGCEQSPDFHPEGAVFNHLLKVLEHLPKDADPSLPWAALLHDIGKPATASRDAESGQIHFYGHEQVGADMARQILERLKFPRRQIEEIVACVRHHMQFKDVFQMRKSTLRRLLLRSTFPLELALHRIDCLGSHGQLDHHEFLVEQALRLEQAPEIRPPLITGRDLSDLGMMPGPAMGRMLKEIREKQLEDELHSKSDALAWARETLKQW